MAQSRVTDNETPYREHATTGEDRREARAKAQAEKAYRKAKRPWYKKKRYVIPLALLAVIAIVSSGGGGDTEPAADSGAQQPTAGQPADNGEADQVGMNQPARDGKFEFTVTSLECGIDSVGGEFLSAEAQGEFCLLGVTVENIGDEAQSLFADNLLLIDAQEREFSADSEATLYHGEDGDSWFSEINPGNSVDGEFVFDVPQGAELVQARLHDSMLSGGVVVNLR